LHSLRSLSLVNSSDHPLETKDREMINAEILAPTEDAFDLDIAFACEIGSGLQEIRMSGQETVSPHLCSATVSGESCTCTDGGTCDFTCGGATGSPCAC
jgi:hypothetical protein